MEGGDEMLDKISKILELSKKELEFLQKINNDSTAEGGNIKIKLFRKNNELYSVKAILDNKKVLYTLKCKNKILYKNKTKKQILFYINKILEK